MMLRPPNPISATLRRADEGSATGTSPSSDDRLQPLPTSRRSGRSLATIPLARPRWTGAGHDTAAQTGWVQEEDGCSRAEPAADVQLLLDLGNELSDAGDEVGAEPYFRAAARLGSAAGSFNLGNALLRQSRPAEAVPAFLEAAEAGDCEALLNLGLAYEDLQDWPAAEAAYRQAVAAGDPQGRLGLGDLLRWHGDPLAAELLWSEAAQDGDGLYAGALARWHLLRNRPDEAEPLLRQAMAVDDDARSDLGHLLRGRGQLEEAQRLLEQGVAKGHHDSMIKLALLLEEDRGDVQRAESVLRAAVAAGEPNNLGTLLRDRGAVLEAQQQFRLGDRLAADNLKRLLRTHRRQLNRAYRAGARAARSARA